MPARAPVHWVSRPAALARADPDDVNDKGAPDVLTRLITATTLALAVSAAFAQTASTPRIDERQGNQESRIQQGVASGELNKREAARLERGQAHVQRMENRATADGVVTGRERARVEHAQDVQSGRIARQKHDRQHAK